MAQDALFGRDGTQAPQPPDPLADPLVGPAMPSALTSDPEPANVPLPRVDLPGLPGDPEQVRAAIEAALSLDGPTAAPAYQQATPFHQQVEPVRRRRFVPKAKPQLPRFARPVDQEPAVPEVRHRAAPAIGIAPATLGFVVLVVVVVVVVLAFLSSLFTWFGGIFG
ncbi:hypothetical protein JOF53_004115 [Crossiella equi]|uniref:Uncharacterized protein n=1 Tax=Crossiella equi TaxID=130796 RepID=A0ABS5AF88_9PSEU|nr:hypothetical protein [Crossiella equi]MBP2475243.1 hypothetical protein [Crossiella equi]